MESCCFWWPERRTDIGRSTSYKVEPFVIDCENVAYD